MKKNSRMEASMCLSPMGTESAIKNVGKGRHLIDQGGTLLSFIQYPTGGVGRVIKIKRG